jgi:hypothetical protein
MAVKFTHNDLRSRHRTLHRAITGVHTSPDDAIAGPCVVFSFSLNAGGAAAATLLDAADTSNAVVTLNTVTDELVEASWEPAGIRFATGLSMAYSGTFNNIYVTYMEE